MRVTHSPRVKHPPRVHLYSVPTPVQVYVPTSRTAHSTLRLRPAKRVRISKADLAVGESAVDTICTNKLSSSSASGPPTSTATLLGFPPPTSIAPSTGIERSSAGSGATTSFGSTPPTSIASSTGIEGSSTDASASSPSSRIPSAIIGAPPDALSQSTSHDARTAAIAGTAFPPHVDRPLST
ncbi:hypothetical protein MVEN_00144500 [Mycena venus]|uniref:Uncharacterized protein n=1 Tax=Mycena venus TaxID=2733690 RepID=A0A8H7DAF7_9AGAR|nr:hypothetical protein MVEN_00144500 [Mycena venus]